MVSPATARLAMAQRQRGAARPVQCEQQSRAAAAIATEARSIRRIRGMENRSELTM